MSIAQTLIVSFLAYRLVVRLVDVKTFMKEVGAFEAKTHLPKLLNQVAQGERIAITRHGKRVALLVPVETPSGLSPREAVARLRALRQGVTWGDEGTVREAIEAGRR